MGKDYTDQDCSLARALEVIGERWTMLVLRDAFYGVRRFSDFVAHLDIPRAVLADRLRRLVDAGLLDRQPDASRAGRDGYVLTRSGRELWPAMHALMRWGSRFSTRPGTPRQFRHADCEERLDEHSACPRCGVVPAAEDVVTVGRRSGPSRDDAVSHALQPPRRLLEPLILDDATG